MADHKLLDDRLSAWLESASVQLDDERIPLYREAIIEMSRSVEGNELDLVHAAYQEPTEQGRAWIASVMRNHDDGFVADGKDALLVRLAGAAVIDALDSWLSPAVTLVNLAVESARFLGLTPAIADTPEVAQFALERAAKRARERPPAPGTAAETVTKLPAARKADEENGVVIAPDDLAEDLASHAKAVRALATRVDEIERASAGRLAVLDEEVEILWWILLGRDASGTTWSERDPVERAVIAAQELKNRTLRLPGPPATSYFLTQILGDDHDSDTSIGELAMAGAPVGSLPAGSDRLLPITSAISAYREVDGKEALWSGLAEAKFQVSTSHKAPLTAGAAQLYRELEMLELLPA